ncbi:alpha/beta hydrolase [Myroides marinus]|uniref:Alpha/beta hydrolase n=1 Tax=Myroides marinus TaxID=703342 RepID=A0A165RJ53_9FLAO|nr:alpha/beta hydrolase [Myroides marinus]KUF43758.1 alpha/beta hydrolase [Myroides marinus]KZE82592.1 alpha/beta hydrolase [Myroides marinus]
MEHQAQINSINIQYETFGTKSNPAVLLISGLGISMTRWTTPFCELLATKGYYIIRYDNRDTGCSTFSDKKFNSPEEVFAVLGKDVIEPPFYSLYDLAKDAILLLDHLKISKVHVIGRSMGGIIGQIIASKYKERVLSLTIIMSTSLNPILPQTSPDVMGRMMAPLPNYQTDKENHIKARLAFTKFISSTDLPFNEQEEIALIEKDYNRNERSNNTLMHVCAVGFTPYDREITASITCPTLIIHGTIDPIFPKEHALDLHQSIANSKLLLIANMGHDLHQDRYAEVIERFIEL